MSRLIMVRHGQASFFTDDYDRLTKLGERQSEALAKHWLEQGERLDALFCGTLQRQRRTGEVVRETFEAAGVDCPELEVLAGLNEYHGDQVMEGLLPELRKRDPRFETLKVEYDNAPEGQERYRTFHRLLEAVMEQYIRGNYDANGFESWPEFRERVQEAFNSIRSRQGSGLHVAAFASGGSIGQIVQTVLRAPDVVAGELNWRIHNASTTQFTYSGERIALDNFNLVHHLRDPELLTYR